MRPRSNVERLIRRVLIIGLLGVGITGLLDDLATAAEAPPELRTFMTLGGAGISAFLAVMFYRAGRPS
jgi:hypothetical protein